MLLYKLITLVYAITFTIQLPRALARQRFAQSALLARQDATNAPVLARTNAVLALLTTTFIIVMLIFLF